MWHDYTLFQHLSACESYDNFVYNTQNKVEKESEIVPNSQFTSLSTNTSLTFLIISFQLHFNFISPNHFSLVFLQHTFIKSRFLLLLLPFHSHHHFSYLIYLLSIALKFNALYCIVCMYK